MACPTCFEQMFVGSRFCDHCGARAVQLSAENSGDWGDCPRCRVRLHLLQVGGTSLSRNSSTRGWTESAWSGAGSGCSAYDGKPSWQTDPNTGVAVLFGGLWFTVGGTSASSPIIASVYALAGNAASVNAGSYPYSHTSGLFDVVSGSNGTCSPSYLCHGQAGYDGPTGLGTPNGVSGF